MAYDTSVEGLIANSKKRVGAINPGIMQRMELIIRRCHARNVHVIFTQGLRTYAEQALLYGKGRASYTFGGKQYGQPKEKIVTRAQPGYSNHNFGYALDFALIKDSKEIIWDTQIDMDKDGVIDWKEVVEEAKKLGFTWGGDWRSFVDMPHIEITGGLTTAQFRAGRRPSLRALTAAELSELKGEVKTAPAKDWSKEYFTKALDKVKVKSGTIGLYKRVTLSKASQLTRIPKDTTLDIIALEEGAQGIPRYKVTYKGETGYITTKRSAITAFTERVSYKVVKGDTLTSIAKAHAMTVAQVKDINKLKTDNLKVGQKLEVFKIKEVKAAGIYKVESGDTLTKIAKANGTTVAKLKALNNLASANLIKVGQVIKLK